MLGDKQYELFQRCLNSYLTINKTEDWTILASSILSNIGEYSTLIDNVQDFEKIDIEKLTKILQDKNIFQIETPGDITRYEEIKRERCNEIIQNSDNVEEIKAAVLQKIYGHSLEYARVIIDKFGEDIEHIEDSDEKYYVMSLKQIMDIDQIDMLYQMYEECDEVGLIDKTLIDRCLKSKYAKLFNKDLYEPSEEMQIQYEDFESVIPIDDEEKRKEIYGELQKLKIYNAGNNFKMMVTSVAPFMENAPTDFKQDWNRPAVASQHFCASYIRQDSIKTIKIPYVCYGFTKMSEDALVLSGTHDIGSSGISNFVSNSYGAEKYYSPDTQIEKTDLYNEMDFRRVQNGKRKQPNYIVAFKRNGNIDNLEMVIKATKDWGGNIPIVIIDVDECEKEAQKQNQMQSEEQTITIQDMEENDTQVTAEERKEGISQIKQLYSKLKQLTTKRTGEDIEK